MRRSLIVTVAASTAMVLLAMLVPMAVLIDDYAMEDQLARAALAELDAAGGEPPSLAELAQRHGDRVANVLRFLERTRAVIQVEPGRFYTKETLAAVLGRIRAAGAAMKTEGR